MVLWFPVIVKLTFEHICITQVNIWPCWWPAARTCWATTVVQWRAYPLFGTTFWPLLSVRLCARLCLSCRSRPMSFVCISCVVLDPPAGHRTPRYFLFVVCCCSSSLELPSTYSASCLVFHLVFLCRPYAGPPAGHILGLIVPEAINIAPRDWACALSSWLLNFHYLPFFLVFFLSFFSFSSPFCFFLFFHPFSCCVHLFILFYFSICSYITMDNRFLVLFGCKW